jgi:hypothetical protein
MFIPIFFVNGIIIVEKSIFVIRKIYALVQILIIRLKLSRVGMAEQAGYQLERGSFTLNIMFTYIKEGIEISTPTVIASEPLWVNFFNSEYYFDFTSFYDIEQDSYSSIGSQFIDAQNEFLNTEVCQGSNYNLICPSSVIAFSCKDALF